MQGAVRISIFVEFHPHFSKVHPLGKVFDEVNGRFVLCCVVLCCASFVANSGFQTALCRLVWNLTSKAAVD